MCCSSKRVLFKRTLLTAWHRKKSDLSPAHGSIRTHNLGISSHLVARLFLHDSGPTIKPLPVVLGWPPSYPEHQLPPRPRPDPSVRRRRLQVFDPRHRHQRLRLRRLDGACLQGHRDALHRGRRASDLPGRHGHHRKILRSPSKPA